MAMQKLKFSLTAFDPTPSECSLAFDEKTCVVESTSNANISVEDYKTTPEGKPSEIYLKVTPDPIAFVMKFIDGKMMIEFKGSWAAFQVECLAKVNKVTEVLESDEIQETRAQVEQVPVVPEEVPAVPEVPPQSDESQDVGLKVIKVPEVAQVEVAQVEVDQVEVTQVEVTQVEESQAQTQVQEVVVEAPVQEVVVESTTETVVVTTTEFSYNICFKVHFIEDDVDAHDIRMYWDLKEFSEPEGANYTIVYQATHADGGREFVIAYFHPVTGELFLLRGIVKDDKVTILNTDKFDQEHVKLYITFYIKDPELQIKIFEEIEANPTWTIMILYKYGIFAEAVDLPSLVTHISKEDADKKPVESQDKEDDEHVRKAREAQKKAEEAGKKGTGPPEDGKPWSCGKVKWELPKEEKKFRDVGKLKIPDFGAKEKESNTKDVGKLKWDGFSAEEPKEVVKEKPKVGKLNLGAFGGAPAEAKAPVKRSWKKKDKKAEENGAK